MYKNIKLLNGVLLTSVCIALSTNALAIDQCIISEKMYEELQDNYFCHESLSIYGCTSAAIATASAATTLLTTAGAKKNNFRARKTKKNLQQPWNQQSLGNAGHPNRLWHDLKERNKQIQKNQLQIERLKLSKPSIPIGAKIGAPNIELNQKIAKQIAVLESKNATQIERIRLIKNNLKRNPKHKSLLNNKLNARKFSTIAKFGLRATAVGAIGTVADIAIRAGTKELIGCPDRKRKNAFLCLDKFCRPQLASCDKLDALLSQDLDTFTEAIQQPQVCDAMKNLTKKTKPTLSQLTTKTCTDDSLKYTFKNGQQSSEHNIVFQSKGKPGKIISRGPWTIKDDDGKPKVIDELTLYLDGKGDLDKIEIAAPITGHKRKISMDQVATTLAPPEDDIFSELSRPVFNKNYQTRFALALREFAAAQRLMTRASQQCPTSKEADDSIEQQSAQ